MSVTAGIKGTRMINGMSVAANNPRLCRISPVVASRPTEVLLGIRELQIQQYQVTARHYTHEFFRRGISAGIKRDMQFI